MSMMQATLPAWRQSTLAIALVGSLLMWASHPPLAFGWLGWIAPVPWLLLVKANELPGRRPYVSLYTAGLVFWLATIHWIRLPHPLLYMGWFALSAYLAIYLPMFVAISRVVMFRLALPLWLAAPIVWTGLELLRAHLLTGFLMASLAHTQAKWPAVIQVSDLAGEYGVDFVIMLVAACFTEIVSPWLSNPQSSRRSSLRAIHGAQSALRHIAIAALPAVVVLFATLAYGHWRIGQLDAAAQSARHLGPRVALIQGNSLAEWKQDPNREGQIMREYIGLSEKALAASRKEGSRAIDLIVWPETMYRSPLRDFDAGYTLPTDFGTTAEELAAADRRQLANLASHLGAPVLVGIDRFHLVADDKSQTERPTVQAFNSAVLVEPSGRIVGTYDKMHRVMFGEYIPFADRVPLLYRITPLTGGIVAGTEPAALRTSDGHTFAPNICYETAIPHVIRRQVSKLADRGTPPDVLVNLTNDAWYWGSSELDLHLACDVFRAVETHVPMVIAANGGISASIDGAGRVSAQIGKQESDFLIVDVEPGATTSPYVRFGDWFAGLALAVCIFSIIVEWRVRRALRHRSIPPPGESEKLLSG